MAGLFDGIGAVRASREASYIKPGRYIVIIDRVKQDVNRNRIPFVAIEMTVIKMLAFETKVTDDPPTWGFMGRDEFKPELKLDCLPHADDEVASHLIMFNNEMALPNFKAFVRDVVGCTENEVTPEACEQLVSDLQPLAGRVVELRARTIITREKKKPFTRVTYGNALTRSEFEAAVGLAADGNPWPAPPTAAWAEEGVAREKPTHAADDIGNTQKVGPN